MAKRPQQLEIKVAEIRGKRVQGQPEMIWHLPFVVTAGGAGAVLKGAELAAKGIEKAIEAKALPPLQFDILDSWIEEDEHRVTVVIHNTTKNGIYIESCEIGREYLNPEELDPNRITRPTVRPPKRIGQSFDTDADPVLEFPLLVKPNEPRTLELSLPKVDRKKMKTERADVTVDFADVGKEKSDTIPFKFRLRWHPHQK